MAFFLFLLNVQTFSDTISKHSYHPNAMKHSIFFSQVCFTFYFIFYFIFYLMIFIFSIIASLQCSVRNIQFLKCSLSKCVYSFSLISESKNEVYPSEVEIARLIFSWDKCIEKSNSPTNQEAILGL